MGKEFQSFDYSVIGNLTEDRMIIGSEVINRPGGAAYFLSMTLLDLGNTVRIHTNGDGVPPLLIERGVIRTGQGGEMITVTIDEQQQRASVDYPGRRIDLSDIPARCFTVDCTVLATTLGEITLDDVRKIRNAQTNVVAADMQGFLRVFGSETHDVTKRRVDLDAFRGFDIIKMNEHEAEIQFPGDTLDTAADELKQLGISVCLFTLGNEGSVVYADQKYSIPTDPVDSLHTVGAGDTFFASFLNSYIRGKDAFSSATDASSYTTSFLQKECL